MAERYQNRSFPADDRRDPRSDPYAQGHSQGYEGYDDPHSAENDPLAELARLIGQSDQFADSAGRAQPPHPLQSRANVRPQPYPAPAPPVASPPQWLQRARQEPAPQPQEYEEHYDEHYEEPEYQPSAVHPLHRYGAQQAEPAHDYHEEQPFADADEAPDPSRYDDALYGQIESEVQQFQRDPAYPDDPYAYQSGEEEEPAPRKRTGMMTVAAVIALAVVGTGAAFGYRTYIGAPRSGQPPVIKADNSPTKVVPAAPDSASKAADRFASADGTEKLISREEAPVDVNAKVAGPRVVFPPLNQNSSPPTVASIATAEPPAAMPAATGTLPNSEPRKVRTLSVKGDAADAGVPSSAPAPAKPKTQTAAPAARGNPSAANASANAPLSLSPQGSSAEPAPAPTRVASTTTAPVTSGGYLVQVSSQRNESDAQASFRALQSKFPSVLGSRTPLIKRADLGERGVYYRAMVGPFASSEEASHVCGNLKSAGGQCVVQRN